MADDVKKDQEISGKDVSDGVEKTSSRSSGAPRPTARKDRSSKERKPLTIARGAVVGGLVAALAVGGGVAYGVSQLMGPSTLGKTTISSDEAGSTVLATYSWKGQRHDVKAQDVLDWSGYSTDSNQSYDVPSASSVLSYVQTEVLAQKAEDEGLSVSDDDIQSYLDESYGGTSLEDAAKGANLTEDQMRSYLSNYLIQQKLYDKVVGEDEQNLQAEPEGPGAPSDDDYDAKTKDYADYIVGLAKSMDEWDDGSSTFKDGSKIGEALADTDFSTDGASYNQAAAAYYAAYQEYQPAAQAVSDKWQDYQNDVFKDVSLVLYDIETY